MNQAQMKSKQELHDEVVGDAVTVTLCVLGAAILCIPFFGFLPLMAACLGFASAVATTRLLDTLGI